MQIVTDFRFLAEKLGEIQRVVGSSQPVERLPSSFQCLHYDVQASLRLLERGLQPLENNIRLHNRQRPQMRNFPAKH